ncbi:MAG TPA: T9SS type A sorting domain-containing protein [Bacteroidia bacterium]|nr:T9SS type A sorting domain-containing protein [Bacteroidia bacterium]
MKQIFILFFLLISSSQIVFGQSELRRPVFTGGGALRIGAGGTGTALTFGQSFARNKTLCVNNQKQRFQIGAQTGVDTTFGFTSCTPVGIIKVVNDSEKFTIYPNPSNGLINLTSSGMSNDLNIQVYSLNGKLLLSDTWFKGEIKQVNLENFSTAIYLVRLTSKDGMTLDKRLINKL